MAQSIGALNTAAPPPAPEGDFYPVQPNVVVFSEPSNTIVIDDEPEGSFQDWIRAKRTSREYVLDDNPTPAGETSAAVEAPRPIIIDDSIGTFGDLLKNTRVNQEGVIDVARPTRASRASRASLDHAVASRLTRESMASLNQLEKGELSATEEASAGSVTAFSWTESLMSTLPDLSAADALPAGEPLVASRLPLLQSSAALRNRGAGNGDGGADSVLGAGTSFVGNSLSNFGTLFGAAVSVTGDSASHSQGRGTGI